MINSLPHILLMGRVPVLGQVKSRLAATVGTSEALRIYELLAERVFESTCVAREQTALRIAVCTPPTRKPRIGAHRQPHDWLPGADAYWDQGSGSLGNKMIRCIQHAFEQGASSAIVVGTDIVGLSADVLERVHQQLNAFDVVFAPTPDGGYALIAMKRPIAELFEDVDWGTSHVAEQTRAKARALGLQVFELKGLSDVDHERDLDGVVPMISVIMPVLNEAERLPAVLDTLSDQMREVAEPINVVIADGGSTDGSIEIARSRGFQVLETAKGRGHQLAAAAAHATGRWLWSLHGDARLAPGALAGALTFCRRDDHPWGFCRIYAEGAQSALRGMTYFNEGRARLFRMPYGDQGMLVKRAVFDAIGGYRRAPLMEDVDLALKLNHYDAPGTVPAELRIDGRRWKAYGVWGTTFRNWWTLAQFLILRTPPEKLARRYRRGRAP